MKELEGYACFVHGAVALGNGLGLLFNLRRGNYRWAAIHAVGILLHVRATIEHAKGAR